MCGVLGDKDDAVLVSVMEALLQSTDIENLYLNDTGRLIFKSGDGQSIQKLDITDQIASLVDKVGRDLVGS